jgi:hypothetical protein
VTNCKATIVDAEKSVSIIDDRLMCAEWMWGVGVRVLRLELDAA